MRAAVGLVVGSAAARAGAARRPSDPAQMLGLPLGVLGARCNGQPERADGLLIGLIAAVYTFDGLWPFRWRPLGMLSLPFDSLLHGNMLNNLRHLCARLAIYAGVLWLIQQRCQQLAAARHAAGGRLGRRRRGRAGTGWSGAMPTSASCSGAARRRPRASGGPLRRRRAQRQVSRPHGLDPLLACRQPQRRRLSRRPSHRSGFCLSYGRRPDRETSRPYSMAPMSGSRARTWPQRSSRDLRRRRIGGDDAFAVAASRKSGVTGAKRAATGGEPPGCRRRLSARRRRARCVTVEPGCS